MPNVFALSFSFYRVLLFFLADNGLVFIQREDASQEEATTA